MSEEQGRINHGSPGLDAARPSSRPVSPVVMLTTSVAPSADELLQAVREATRGRYDVLGAVPQLPGGSPVYGAREISSGRLVAFRLARDEQGGTGFVLALADVAVSLADVVPAAAHGARLESPDAGARPMRCSRCRGTYELGTRFCPRDGAPLDSLIIGQVLGDKYLVERLLGRGGMGEVYLARHVHLDKLFAIKVMNRAGTDDPDALGRFHFEAKAAARLTHPNVATVYDVGDTPDGVVYFIMEYVPGESLSALVAREGPLTPARAAVLVAQLADGLGAAHDLGLVHRDLKPDNVLVARRRDGGDLAKIVDFGIAKAVDGDGPRRTRTGVIIGTPEFMSPEQVRGQRLDGRSDIYALGLVTFYVLTADVAFAGDTGNEQMMRRLSERPMTLAQVKPDVAWPAAVQSVMKRVLARDPAHRYQSAAAFGSALATAVADWERALNRPERAPDELPKVVSSSLRLTRDFSTAFRVRLDSVRPRRGMAWLSNVGRASTTGTGAGEIAPAIRYVGMFAFALVLYIAWGMHTAVTACLLLSVPATLGPWLYTWRERNVNRHVMGALLSIVSGAATVVYARRGSSSMPGLLAWGGLGALVGWAAYAWVLPPAGRLKWSAITDKGLRGLAATHPAFTSAFAISVLSVLVYAVAVSLGPMPR